ncbi:5-oxoprolinase subunit PxpB [Streptomyces zagrosensis]|uniref:5-oxoprolinase subunit PxpB n=1 Tax=Streptomyces zagrosensis TaxID=1042984 RepID=UPI001618E85C|nr:5-oxoprolinase subunit PxpB [Streptomyces zagrosensis]
MEGAEGVNEANEVAQSGSFTVRGLPVGDHALLLEVGSDEAVEALHAELLRRVGTPALPAVREIVPAARTVLLDGLTDPARTAARLTEWHIPALTRDQGAAVEIPVRYDGPDLRDVAKLWGVTPDEVVRIHSGTEFRVAFCGFAPGFGYLTGLPDRYHVPRRATPRTRVPVGSLALAGPYTGVYPRSSPGGWQLIGTSNAVLWDAAREPAALFAPGTRVRFVPQEEPLTPGQGGAAAHAEGTPVTEGLPRQSARSAANEVAR